MPKVALVHEYLNQWGGAERVLDRLHVLYPSAPIYTLIYDRELTKGYFEGWDIRPSFLQRSLFKQLRKYTLPFGALAVESYDLADYDLVISSSNSFAKGVLTRPETTHICYCHTPTAYLWSWSHQYLAEQRLNKVSNIMARLILHRLRQWDRLAAERVDYWVANSLNVQQRIKKYYRKKSVVIYPPVDTSRFKLSNKKDDYYLYVGRLSGYKKPDLVISAFNRLGRSLLIVGEGQERRRLERMSRTNIKFTGWLPDDKVADLYSRSRAVVFPVVEDFGIVPVEAMASGCPVIALGRGGAKETVIDGQTGVLFPEQSTHSLIEAVKRFEKKESNFQGQKLRRHALRFDQAVFSDRMKRFIEKVSAKQRTSVRPASQF